MKIKISDEKRNQIMALIAEENGDENQESRPNSPKNCIVIEDFSSEDES